MAHINTQPEGRRSVSEDGSVIYNRDHTYRLDNIQMVDMLNDNEHAYTYYLVLKPLNGKKDMSCGALLDKLRSKFKGYRHIVITQEKATRIHFNVVVVVNDSEFVPKFDAKIFYNTYYCSAKRLDSNPIRHLVNYITKDQGDEYYQMMFSTRGSYKN